MGIKRIERQREKIRKTKIKTKASKKQNERERHCGKKGQEREYIKRKEGKGKRGKREYLKWYKNYSPR